MLGTQVLLNAGPRSYPGLFIYYLFCQAHSTLYTRGFQLTNERTHEVMYIMVLMK